MIEDFFSEAEVAEMLGAGKAMCFDAPKEQRKVFSTTDPSTSQVINTIHHNQLKNPNDNVIKLYF